MLLLTRKEGEWIVIGDDIRLTVARIRGGQVSFGIDAPNDVPVHRKEVADRIREGRGRPPSRDSERPSDSAH